MKVCAPRVLKLGAAKIRLYVLKEKKFLGTVGHTK
jgi:hypothetical protein